MRLCSMPIRFYCSFHELLDCALEPRGTSRTSRRMPCDARQRIAHALRRPGQSLACLPHHDPCELPCS